MTTVASIRTHRIEYVAIKLSPLNNMAADPLEESWLPEFADLPEVYVAALDAIVRNADNVECDSCGNGVGYVLHEDDDNPARSGCRWHSVWLAREDNGPVVALCEDCSPRA